MNESNFESKPRGKFPIFIIIFIIISIIALGAVIYLKKDDIFKSKKIETKEKNKEAQELSKKVQKGVLSLEDDIKGTTITINGKEHTIENKTEEIDGEYVEVLSLNDKILYKSEEGLIGIKYEVFRTAKDNKEYLFLSFHEWGTYDCFINDSAETIKVIDSNMEVEENCFYTTEEAFDKMETLTNVKDGVIYYYIYKGPYENYNYQTPINLYEVKASIINNQFNDEGETGKIILGTHSDCE